MINDVIDIKNRNIKDILNVIRFEEGLTKKEIALMTGLSFSTVSNLCNELKDLQIVTDEKKVSKGIGRKPYTLSLNYEQFHSICIDLQLENTLRVAILDLQNNIVCKEEYDTSELKDTFQIAQYTKEILDELIERMGISVSQIIGVGISVPAVYDLKNGRLVNSSVSIYEDAPLKQDFSKILQLPVYIDNIANFYALSKQTYFPNYKNIVCMDISQGVGVGVISEGNLVRGKSGYGTEVAHVPIGDPTKRCPLCGGYGCVETELSLNGILELALENVDKEPILSRWNKFIDYLESNVTLAEEIAEKTGSLAGKLSTILINLFDPDLFFIGGYVSDLPVKIKPYLINEINLRCDKSIARGLEIVCEERDSEQIFIGISNTVYNGWNPIHKVV
jgi:predicted NBD/HSP70 family sugar kinase